MLDEVIAVLRDGERIQVGGGRSFSWYAMKDGQLVIINSCDGELEEYPCSEERLSAAIAEAPHVFADAVRWWKEKR